MALLLVSFIISWEGKCVKLRYVTGLLQACAALAVVLVLILVIILILVLILVLVVILVLLLVVLLIHGNYLRKLWYSGYAAFLGCPVVKDLSLGLKIRLASRPAKMAVAMPPAQELRPPVKMPRKPFSAMASRTPRVSA